MLVSVVKNEERRVKNSCVWIIAHRRELVSQIEETLKASLNVESESLSVKRGMPSAIRVCSIQWLTRRYQELEDKPSWIVIDEAHHAVAKTYAEVMNAYPEAKKLGVTATPCRLNRKGFTDLFDDLLCSHSIAKFIKDGYLSAFDYVSLNPSCEDQKKIECFGHVWRHHSCPRGASTLPNRGKHVTQLGQARCPFFDKLVYLKRVVSRLFAKQKNNDRLEVEKQT